MSSYLKKKIIAKVAPVITHLKVHKLFTPIYGGLGHILTFHRVVPESKSPRIHNHLSLEVSPKQLEETILFYKKSGYRFISLDDLYDNLQAENAADKFVVFTFDDGYKDNLTHAYPILKKHVVPFTIYVTTNFPDHKAILWWYLLENVILKNEQVCFSWEGVEHLVDCKSIKSKETAFDQLRTFINQRFQQSNYLELLMTVLNKNEEDLYAYSKSLALNWEEIKLLSADPLCTIGAHTVNHFPLSRLSEKELKFEIQTSKERIENFIEKPVDHFAYPFGKSSEASKREFSMVKDLGFKTGTTTRMGNIFKEHRSMTECLPRISLNKVTTPEVLNIQASGMLPFFVHRGKRIITD